ncbi:hypothetical protein [Prauserella rugosa]|uniref:Excreted virulence factor EspC (Type VII ESX diderm) n=1 Tax=Prauserella rugosa TaxID=43354 RepID=A0A660C968_9PSEU|nr:hypothetical protein [Prauserella rugosa]KMS78111.1 hypothetical protein ACZ91_63675 [Streptomyces regensis]TWH18363.1 hypothetical protein JD82_00180 [Prauserella rugosa]
MPEFGDVPESGGVSRGAAIGAGIGAAGSAMAKQVGDAKAQSSALLESAKGGGFRVSENAAQPIRDALIEANDDLNRILGEANTLTAAPKLGTGPYAQQVAEHVQQSGDGPQGVLPMLRQLRTVIRQSEEALKIAMDNYRESEDQQKQTFNG